MIIVQSEYCIECNHSMFVPRDRSSRSLHSLWIQQTNLEIVRFFHYDRDEHYGSSKEDLQETRSSVEHLPLGKIERETSFVRRTETDGSRSEDS